MLILFSLVVLLHLIGSVFTYPEVCNPIECFNIFDTFFQPCLVGEECRCEKITELEKCARLCIRNETENLILEGLQEVKEDLCQVYQEFKLENKCENKHKFRLISCVYGKLHLKTVDPNSSKNLLMCRRAFDGEMCDRESVELCTDRETYLSQLLLVKFFAPLRNKNCVSFSAEDVWNLNVNSLAYLKDYNKLAECLDINSPHVTDCIPRKWTTTNIQEESMLCSVVHSFLNCVEKVVEGKCSSLKSTFTSIQEPFISYLLPTCSSNSALPLAPNDAFDSHPNEVYSEAKVEDTVSTVPPKNASEVVVVHQHVVISVNYRSKNAANHIRVSGCLVAMVIFFIFLKPR